MTRRASSRQDVAARAWLLGGVLTPVFLLASVLLAGCETGSSAMPNLSATDKAFVLAAATWDVDKNGVVTCDEWKAYATDLFRGAHGGTDGALNRDEFSKMVKVDRLFETADFAYFDTNKDGAVTLAELTDKPNPAFGFLDKNHDCSLTNDEMPTIWGPAANRGLADRGPGGGRRGGR